MKHLIGWRGYAVAAALAFLLGFGGCWKLRDWMAAEAAQKVAQAQTKASEAARVQERRAVAVSDTIGARHEVAAANIRTVTRTLIREVPVYVTAEADARCVVPVGFVRLHDAAASGRPASLPDPAGQSHDAPSGLDLSAVGGVVAENYGTCREDAQRLIDLQDWVTAQRELANAP